MSSSYIYVYDHGHRPRMNGQEYNALLDGGEVVAALILATPGFAWVLWSQLKAWHKEHEKIQALQPLGTNDNTIWPPPPTE